MRGSHDNEPPTAVALAALGVFVIGGGGKHPRTGTVGHHGSPVRAGRVGFTLDNRPPGVRPRAGLVLEGVKQPLLVAGAFVLRHGLGQQSLAFPL